jgi:hypothetical protein
MPRLVTKTIRIRQDQALKLDIEFKESSSFLLRKLLDIYLTASLPGAEIVKLRKEVKDYKPNFGRPRLIA